KEALLNEIKSADFDFETGVTPEQTYQRERYKLVQQAAGILRQIDQLPDETDSIDAQIEAAIKALRGIPPAVNSPSPAKSETKNAPLCPQCHDPIAQADKFCRGCGEKLA
ncbi:MAG: hypothetical protein ACPG8W_22370, partial [Candidatus Promineifilaceae bacterium]